MTSGGKRAKGATAVWQRAVVEDPRRIVRGIQKVSFGPIAAEWSADARVAAQTVANEGHEGDTAQEDAGDDLAARRDEDDDHALLRERLRLQKKLAYLAKHQLAVNGVPTYLTIGSLNEDGGLTDEQAKTADLLMTVTDADIAAWPQAKRRDLIQNVTGFVKNFRATVHYNLTFGRICERAKKQGWSVVEVDQKGPRRPFLQVERGDGRRFRIAPIYALSDKSSNLSKARNWIADSIQHPPRADERLLVVPDNSVVTPINDAQLRVVKIGDILEALSDDT